MKNFNFILGVLSVVALSACGSQSMKESTSSIAGSTASTGTPTGSTTTPGGNIYNLPAAPRQRVELGGNNSPDFQKILTVMTDRTLRVKIKPLPAPNIIVPGYSNWVFPYGCMSVSVTVNGVTRGTQTLRVEGVTQAPNSACANSPTEEIIDFTDVMTGTGQTQVIISNANYDNCRQYWPLNYGPSCGGGMSAVWQNHRVAMDATVQVDNTWM